MEDFPQLNTPSSSNVSASNKKKNRIDSVALALASRMSSTAASSFSRFCANPGPSVAESQQQIPYCSICQVPMDDKTLKKTCSICKRHMHAECVVSDATAFFEANTCSTCCKRSFSHLVADNALLSTSFDAPDKDVPLSDDNTTLLDNTAVPSQSLNDFVGGGQQNVPLCAITSAASMEGVVNYCTTAAIASPISRDSIAGRMVENFSHSASPPPPSSGTPTSRSSTPLFTQDGECSDNEEYHPPGTIVRRTESTRGGRGKGRKPTSATLHRQTSTAMRTRSFGKPPSSTVSYASKFDDIHFKAEEEKPGCKKSRGNASKGKGGNRGRRPTGGGGSRGSKLVSVYANALTATMTTPSSLMRSEHNATNERRKEEEGGMETATDKEYIRTCVVTSLEDKFMTEVSMCLVCGSIGRGAEGSMITCSCCAQSFHTYCVLMHDKLKPTVMKRGWRCLDCTVCEGCGSGEDEPNLLLCDECDISYHIYCLEPPLDCIPCGPWRCKWCATCSRCSAQIKIGSDMQRLEGFCEVCFSLRKCLKCQMPYEIGDLMLKCGRCFRWLHARCEGLTTEEQAENAAENAFRCSFCRPQTFNDASNAPVVVDNVMISKSAVDQIQNILSIRKLTGFANLGEHFGNIPRSISYEQDDMDLSDELQEQLIASVIAGRGRGSAGGVGRGGGPGRRMLKIGVGGFYVRTPKSRLPLLMCTGGANLAPMSSTEEEQQQQIGATLLEEDGSSTLLGPNGKPRIRRPRKLKRPLLEDAYPPQIQESFFGVAAVDSRKLAEQTVDEPALDDYKKTVPIFSFSKFASELSEHSAELLRTEQEMDMLGDIPLVDNIMDGLDMEGIDFSDLIVGEDDDDPMTVESSSNNDGYNVGSSSNLVAQSVSEVFSPSSCSSIRTPSRVLDSAPPPLTSSSVVVAPQSNVASFVRQQQISDNGGGKLVDQQQKQSATAITTERWEEDEPLGDKATKAAVLYANVHHAYLKDKFPVWVDRVRQINRVWRELNADKRQEFVEWARKNRANCPTIRRRGRRTISIESAVQRQQHNAHMGSQNVGQIQSLPTSATSRPATTTTTPVLVVDQQDTLTKNGATAKGITNTTKMEILSSQEQQQLESMLQHQQQFRELPPHPSSLTLKTPKPEQLQQHHSFAALESSNQCSSTVVVGNSVATVGCTTMSTQQQQNIFGGGQSATPTAVSFNATVFPDSNNGLKRVFQQQQQSLMVEQDVKLEETRFEQLKKDKRALAARQRLLLKKTHPMTPEEASRHALDLQTVQTNLDNAKKALQVQQRLVDRQRQRLKQQQQTQQAATSVQLQLKTPTALSTSTLLGQNTNANMVVVRPSSMIDLQQQQYQMHNQHQQLKTMETQQQRQDLMTTHQQQRLTLATELEQSPNASSAQHQQPTTSGFFFNEQQRPNQQQRIALQKVECEEKSRPKIATTKATTPDELKPIIVVGQQVKGTRGRKRKKPLPENVRTQVLGGVSFTSLGTQLERDVFDTVDALVGFISTNMDSNDSGMLTDDTLLVQKILSQQHNNQNGSHATGASQLGVGKPKKRRQTQTKTRNQSEVTNELDLIQERIKKSMETISSITNYMEQYQANDKQMMKFPDQSALPEHEGSEPPLRGSVLGEYTLPFMPDYYDELERVREYVDEESLFPQTMGEICWDADLNAVAKELDDPLSVSNGEDSSICPNVFFPGKCNSEDEACGSDEEPLLHFLSVDKIGNRSKIVKSMSLLGVQGPSQEAPLEPHWSRFDEEPRDLDREVDVVLIVDPSVMPRNEFVESLGQILGITDINHITELDTPPYTPDSPRNDGYYGHHQLDNSSSNNHQQRYNQTQKKDDQLQKGCENNECTEVKAEMALDELNSVGSRDKIICRNCNSFIPAGKTPIDDTHRRLGILSESIEEKLYFCSMQCYYKFLALYRVPLNVESLEMAERHVDNVTLETLRQVSADTFAKRINAGLPPHSRFLSEQYSSAVSAATVPTATALGTSNAMAIDGGATLLQREFLIKSSELAALLLVQQNLSKKRAAHALSERGFKWRGIGWNICDTTLVQSFKQRQCDGTKQFVAIHLQTNEKCVNWSDDSRQCSFCEQIGDGDQRLTGRLLNVDANKWVHVNCALWSAEVHVAEDGGLINVEAALRRAKMTECRLCGHKGASIRCYKLDCANNELAFHLVCAKQSLGHFVKDKTFFCVEHDIRPDAVVADLSALRRLFVQRDENQLLSKIFNHSYQTEMVMRVGSLIFHRIGQLLPDQLKAFTTDEHIFPVGYRVTRLFWSSCHINDRMRYECSVVDRDGKPEFCVENIDHATTAGAQKEWRGTFPTEAWTTILHAIADSRTNSSSDVLRFFPKQMSGEYLYGFLEPSISKMLESLPGIDQLYTYTFKHGGTPLMDLPLAENPSGCARCEPCFRTLVKQRHRPIISNSPKKNIVSSAIFGSDAVVPREGRSTRNSSARFALSAKFDQEMLRAYKASGISERMLFQTTYLRSNDMAQLVVQYKEMKREYKSNVYLARSKIQGMGLYAKRDLDMNQMIIEYIGELIRSEVCEIRQSRYIEQNRGEYMFRIDCDWVVDATMAGGLARYINHSCDPNCGTKILPVNDEKKVVIFANRPIKAGEELTYDYQFDIEETGKKIPCLCGAPNCVKWMN